MSRRSRYKFRLYVTGSAPNSVQAQANLASLCKIHLPDRFEIEIIDVLEQPMLALKDNILMTPTLLKLSPAPVRRIIGALSEMQTVLDELGLQVAVK